MSSVHSKLNRVRKPRVHITYDVHTGNATEKKHLPFVLGVVGDFSGNEPTAPLKALKDRKFTTIDRDNINEVLKNMTPGLNLEVENTLADQDKSGETKMMKVKLKFESMEDFSPARVAAQVEPLKELLEIRDKLRDLRSKMDVSTNLENALEDVLKNADNVTKLANELGVDPSKPAE